MYIHWDTLELLFEVTYNAVFSEIFSEEFCLIMQFSLWNAELQFYHKEAVCVCVSMTMS